MIGSENTHTAKAIDRGRLMAGPDVRTVIETGAETYQRYCSEALRTWTVSSLLSRVS